MAPNCPSDFQRAREHLRPGLRLAPFRNCCLHEPTPPCGLGPRPTTTFWLWRAKKHHHVSGKLSVPSLPSVSRHTHQLRCLEWLGQSLTWLRACQQCPVPHPRHHSGLPIPLPHRTRAGSDQAMWQHPSGAVVSPSRASLGLCFRAPFALLSHAAGVVRWAADGLLFSVVTLSP